MFVYERGMNAGVDIALDDITVSHEGCYNEPIPPPGNNNGNLKLYSAVYQALNASVHCFISFSLDLL